MIEKLFLENFQGFGKFSEIRLAPITLIFGPNSGGKSSVIRALRLMQQGVKNSRRRPGTFRFDSDEIDLGSFENVVHHHDESKKMRIGVEFENFDSKKAVDRSFWVDKVVFTIGATGNPSELLISGGNLTEDIDNDYFDIRWLESAETSEQEKSLTPRRAFELTPMSTRVFNKLLKVGTNSTSTSVATKVVRDWDKFLRSLLSSDHMTNDFDFDEFQKDAVSAKIGWILEEFFPSIRTPTMPEKYSQQTADATGRVRFAWDRMVAERSSVVIDAIGELRELYSNQFSEDSMLYVGPLRPIPDRLTIVNSGAQDSARDPGDIPSFLATNTNARLQVSKWINKLTRGAYLLDFLEFNSGKVSLVGNVGALVLQDTRSKAHVSFKDVGVGLSQVLPILSTLIGAERFTPRRSRTRRTSTILIEQPELHLHPTMQGQLMSLFVDHVKGSENRQIIAETHSENMILRLQHEIKKGNISSESVSVVYVDRNENNGSSRIEHLHLNENGDFISTWPESFSDSRFTQIAGE